MCRFFVLKMDNYQGDLTDIIRASGGALGQSSDASCWDFPSDPFTALDQEGTGRESVFGDPFCNMRDPLLHELNVSYFNTPPNTSNATTTSLVDDANNFCGGGPNSSCCGSSSNMFPDHHHLEMHHNNNNNNNNSSSSSSSSTPMPCNMFSRIQISSSPNCNHKLPSVSPCDSPVMPSSSSSSPRGFKPSVMLSADMVNANTTSSKTTSCLIENSGPVQISSPRNLGIKRRKSQAKKVVCIPAPQAVNSRPSGEVVPSDLWAWRKYGQKPIKGSPYPRGYYRCSSSKGCSARKQVERSRTDPNMLVITYTSEHNHPWPTQRNALAGSTRSQPPKNANAASKSSPGQKTKEEAHKESSTNDATLSPNINNTNNSVASAPVKEEVHEDIDHQKQVMEADDDDTDQFNAEYNEGFPQSYRPALPDDSCCQQQSEDFFAELGEIEADPLDLLFTQEFCTGSEDQKQSKALDPFSIFDWSGDNINNNNNTTTSFGEAKRGV